MLDVLAKSEKEYASMLRVIKDVDMDNNGFLTVTELDDILKLVYKVDFKDKDLSLFIKRFRSIQNRVLVDYRAVKKVI